MSHTFRVGAEIHENAHKVAKVRQPNDEEKVDVPQSEDQRS